MLVDERDGLTGHAFISYVHENSRDVDQLQRTLEAAGIRVWRDTADLWPGEDWRARIRNAITNDALIFIACFSCESVARKVSYQNEELTLAIEEMRKRPPEEPWLIPVRLDDCKIPYRDIGGGRTLNSIQWADLFGDGTEVGAERLVATVLRILGRYSVIPRIVSEEVNTVLGEDAHRAARELEQLTYSTQNLNGTTSEVISQRIEETQRWLRKAIVVIGYWETDLLIDYRDSLELAEATELKIIAQLLRDGLGRYLFGDQAYLKEIDRHAWEGIKMRWSYIRMIIVKLLRETTDYSNWLKELKGKDSQITDPLALRNMVREKGANTGIISSEYAELVNTIKPILEEVLQFL